MLLHANACLLQMVHRHGAVDMLDVRQFVTVTMVEHVYLREFPTPVILDQARERAALTGKSAIGFRTKIVTCLIRSFRVEWRAPIDRGDRDLSFEPWGSRIPRGFGMSIFTR